MSKQSPEKKPKVLIIGAGISGLAAAVLLTESGNCDVTVLEAQERIGGRVFSSNEFGGQGHVEYGANWLHGTEGNPLYEFAKEHGLIKNSSSDIDCEDVIKGKTGQWFELASDTDKYCTEDGKAIDPQLVETVQKLFSGLSAECDKVAMEGLAVEDPQLHSVGQYMDQKFQEWLQENCSNKDKKEVSDLYMWMKRSECLDNACQSLDDLSLQAFGEAVAFPGEYYTLLKENGGFASIISQLSSKLPSDSIKLNKAVKRLVWRNEGAAAAQATKEGKGAGAEKDNWRSRIAPCLVTAECEDGEVLRADHVIVTASLGFLKERVGSFFHPPLPADKMAAIDSLGFGTVDKIFLEYDLDVDRFWRTGCFGIQLVWDQDSPFGVGTGQRTPPPDETNTEGRQWFKNILGFDRISGHPNLLIAWVSGWEAEHMETLTDQEIGRTCTEVLKHFLKKAVPGPVRVHATRWRSNPYIRGSYSHSPLGASAAMFDNLAQPIYHYCGNHQERKPVLLFAGEHTSREFLSTSHGSYCSGQKAAKHINHFYEHIQDI